MTIDPTTPRTRRALIGAGLGAVIATVAGALGRPSVTLAANPPVLLNQDNSATDTTGILVGGGAVAIRAQSNMNGAAIVGIGPAGIGTKGYSTTGDGIVGASPDGTGVHGVSGPDYNFYPTGYPSAVLGETRLPAGVSILGNNYATTGIAIGVQGTSHSSAGLASVGWGRGGGTGVIGVSGATFPTVPAKTGVYGNAPAGRGVVAAGGVAQLRLVPSTATTHPASGARGDLFLDKGGNLWLCKGGTSWNQFSLV